MVTVLLFVIAWMYATGTLVTGYAIAVTGFRSFSVMKRSVYMAMWPVTVVVIIVAFTYNEWKMRDRNEVQIGKARFN